MRGAFERVFGEQLLQIGAWGARNTFLRYARTQRRALVDWRPGVNADLDLRPRAARDRERLRRRGAAAAHARANRVAARAAARGRPNPAARRPSDRAELCAPAACGACGICWRAAAIPQGRDRMIREGRLRDWLELLSFDVAAATRYCHTLPIERFKQLRFLPREEWAQTLAADSSSGGYLLRAQKRVHPLTPVRMWQRQPRLRVVGGFVEPTTRAPRARAAAPARALRSPPRALVKAVEAFTDGACRGNPGPGGWGVASARRRARQRALGRRACSRPTIAWSSRPRSRRSTALKQPCRVAALHRFDLRAQRHHGVAAGAGARAAGERPTASPSRIRICGRRSSDARRAPSGRSGTG